MFSLVLTLLLSVGGCHSLSGLHFEDNKSDKRFVQDNGEVNFKIETYPHQVREDLPRSCLVLVNKVLVALKI